MRTLRRRKVNKQTVEAKEQKHPDRLNTGKAGGKVARKGKDWFSVYSNAKIQTSQCICL